jgi:hypothetical protein
VNGAEDAIFASLRAQVEAGDAAAIDRELGRLLADEATPVLWRAIRSQLPDLPRAEQEEVHGDALLRLTMMLQRLVQGDPDLRIESFRAYVSATAANGCRAFLRSRHPERTRLQNQLRYLLRNDPGLALWESAERTVLCGLSAWRDRDDFAEHSGAALATARESFLATAGGVRAAAALPELLRRYFLWRARPVGFAELTADVAEALGVRDLPLVSLTPDDDSGGAAGNENAIDPVEGRPDAHQEIEDRQFLGRLWEEVQELPRGQRVALLLNLRDNQGRDRLRLFPLTGVASLADLARTLELPVAELESLWETLPLDDRSIADLLAVTQRQVINLRKSGRARLGRRLALFGRAGG